METFLTMGSFSSPSTLSRGLLQVGRQIQLSQMGGCYWHLVARSQGRCEASCSILDSSPYQRIVLPQCQHTTVQKPWTKRLTVQQKKYSIDPQSGGPLVPSHTTASKKQLTLESNRIAYGWGTDKAQLENDSIEA